MKEICAFYSVLLNTLLTIISANTDTIVNNNDITSLVSCATAAVTAGADARAECVRRVRATVADVTRFWFGDDWRFNCAEGGFRQRTTGDWRASRCWNQRDLQSYHSLGARLFRVPTFADALLASVRFVPRVIFTPQSSSYRACDHHFEIIENRSAWEVGFDTQPINAYQTRHAPSIEFPGGDTASLADDKFDGINDLMGSKSSSYYSSSFSSSTSHQQHHNQSQLQYVVLIVDVGMGVLKYAAAGFPHEPSVLVAYSSLDNFRVSQPTPFAVLVFEQPASRTDIYVNAVRNADEADSAESGEHVATFDLGQFILDNELDDALIGFNWFLVSADAYSIERHRVRGTIDNCHALLQQKLIDDRRWSFVPLIGIEEMDASLSVSAHRPRADVSLCCRVISVSEATVFADPLGDGQIESSALRVAPMVASLRSLIAVNGDNYQRSQRHYIVIKEERYTLVVFDPSRLYLHWLVVDVPAEALSLGDVAREGRLVAPYISPIPKDYGSDGKEACSYAVFALFRQSAGHAMIDYYSNYHVLRSRLCVRHCHHRESFSLEEFKSLHQLRLSALSWARVCYDVFEAEREILGLFESPSLHAIAANASRAVRARKPSVDGVAQWTRESAARSSERKRVRARQICARLFGVQYADECQRNASLAYRMQSIKILFFLPFILLQFCAVYQFDCGFFSAFFN